MKEGDEIEDRTEWDSKEGEQRGGLRKAKGGIVGNCGAEREGCGGVAHRVHIGVE
jgi:hypothetical protein